MYNCATYKRYSALVLILTPLLVSLVLLVIIKTTDGYNAFNPIIREAIEWQSRTRGTAAISMKLSTSFKHRSSIKYINENSINTIIFGSSTVMGIRSKMFPKPYLAHNFSTNGNPLSVSIGETNYFIKSNENIRWAVVPMDYAIGFIFSHMPIQKYQPGIQNEKISLIEKVQDAITLDRLKITIHNLWQNLLVAESKQYDCPEEDGIGRDFGTIRAPGKCDGFRYDGSATFHYWHMTNVEWKKNLSFNGMKKFINSLNISSGEINNAYLTELAMIDKQLKKRSGRLIALLPPLMPGAEKYLLESTAGIHLQQFKMDLIEWAQDNNIYLIDAGQSENYGCSYNDFYDQEHALENCYTKLFLREFNS